MTSEKNKSDQYNNTDDSSSISIIELTKTNINKINDLPNLKINDMNKNNILINNKPIPIKNQNNITKIKPPKMKYPKSNTLSYNDHDECRYCLETEPRENLFQPCSCTQKVHRECLDEARIKNPNRIAFHTCTECHYKFKMNVESDYPKDKIERKYKLLIVRDIILITSIMIAIIISISCIVYKIDSNKYLAKKITRAKFNSDISNKQLIGIYFMFGLMISFIILGIYAFLHWLYSLCRKPSNNGYGSTYCCIETGGCNCGNCDNCGGGGGSGGEIVAIFFLIFGFFAVFYYAGVIIEKICKRHSSILKSKLNAPIYKIANYDDLNAQHIEISF